MNTSIHGQHDTEAAAYEAAEALVRAYPASVVFVLKTIGKVEVQKPPIVRETY